VFAVSSAFLGRLWFEPLEFGDDRRLRVLEADAVLLDGFAGR
jgi:hypothetical protein